jgi:hypothetical protein
MWENDGLWGMTRERPTHVPVELHSQGVGSGGREQRARPISVRYQIHRSAAGERSSTATAGEPLCGVTKGSVILLNLASEETTTRDE